MHPATSARSGQQARLDRTCSRRVHCCFSQGTQPVLRRPSVLPPAKMMMRRWRSGGGWRACVGCCGQAGGLETFAFVEVLNT
eukprot:gene12418-biopygen16936